MISHGTSNGEMRLMTTDSFHRKPSKPIISPATMPVTMQMAFSHLRSMLFNSSMPSINMLLPRETMNPTSPHAIAAAKDSPSSTRQATLPMGTSVHNHE